METNKKYQEAKGELINLVAYQGHRCDCAVCTVNRLLSAKLPNGCRLAIVQDDPSDCGFNKVNEIKPSEEK